MFPLSPPGACTSATTQEILAARGGTVGENLSSNFCLNSDFHGTFRDLLHDANLRHGSDGFTSPPKEVYKFIIWCATYCRQESWSCIAWAEHRQNVPRITLVTWAWQECNRLLRFERPWGAVTLSRWCVSGDRGGCSARRGLKPKFY